MKAEEIHLILKGSFRLEPLKSDFYHISLCSDCFVNSSVKYISQEHYLGAFDIGIFRIICLYFSSDQMKHY
jgi:hypothetical protein